jgi:hypothetical protein
MTPIEWVEAFGFMKIPSASEEAIAFFFKLKITNSFYLMDYITFGNC